MQRNYSPYVAVASQSPSAPINVHHTRADDLSMHHASSKPPPAPSPLQPHLAAAYAYAQSAAASGGRLPALMTSHSLTVVSSAQGAGGGYLATDSGINRTSSKSRTERELTDNNVTIQHRSSSPNTPLSHQHHHHEHRLSVATVGMYPHATPSSTPLPRPSLSLSPTLRLNASPTGSGGASGVAASPQRSVIPNGGFIAGGPLNASVSLRVGSATVAGGSLGISGRSTLAGGLGGGGGVSTPMSGTMSLSRRSDAHPVYHGIYNGPSAMYDTSEGAAPLGEYSSFSKQRTNANGRAFTTMRSNSQSSHSVLSASSSGMGGGGGGGGRPSTSSSSMSAAGTSHDQRGHSAGRHGSNRPPFSAGSPLASPRRAGAAPSEQAANAPLDPLTTIMLGSLGTSASVMNGAGSIGSTYKDLNSPSVSSGVEGVNATHRLVHHQHHNGNCGGTISNLGPEDRPSSQSSSAAVAELRYGVALWTPQLTVARSSYQHLELSRVDEISRWTPATVASELNKSRAFHGLSMLVDAKVVHAYLNYVDEVRMRQDAEARRLLEQYNGVGYYYKNGEFTYAAAPRTAEEEAARGNTSTLGVLQRDLAALRFVTENFKSMHSAQDGEVEAARLAATREKERLEARGVPTEVFPLRAGPPFYHKIAGLPEKLMQRLPLGEALFLNNVDGSRLLALTEEDLVAHFGLTRSVAKVAIRSIRELKTPSAVDEQPLPSTLKELLEEQKWDLQFADEQNNSNQKQRNCGNGPCSDNEADGVHESSNSNLFQLHSTSASTTPMARRSKPQREREGENDKSACRVVLSSPDSVSSSPPLSAQHKSTQGSAQRSRRRASTSCYLNSTQESQTAAAHVNARHRPVLSSHSSSRCSSGGVRGGEEERDTASAHSALASQLSSVREHVGKGVAASNEEFKKWSSLSRADQFRRLAEERERAIKQKQQEADTVAKATEVDASHISPFELLELAGGLAASTAPSASKSNRVGRDSLLFTAAVSGMADDNDNDHTLDGGDIATPARLGAGPSALERQIKAIGLLERERRSTALTDLYTAMEGYFTYLEDEKALCGVFGGGVFEPEESRFQGEAQSMHCEGSDAHVYDVSSPFSPFSADSVAANSPFGCSAEVLVSSNRTLKEKQQSSSFSAAPPTATILKPQPSTTTGPSTTSATAGDSEDPAKASAFFAPRKGFGGAPLTRQVDSGVDMNDRDEEHVPPRPHTAQDYYPHSTGASDEKPNKQKKERPSSARVTFQQHQRQQRHPQSQGEHEAGGPPIVPMPAFGSHHDSDTHDGRGERAGGNSSVTSSTSPFRAPPRDNNNNASSHSTTNTTNTARRSASSNSIAVSMNPAIFGNSYTTANAFGIGVIPHVNGTGAATATHVAEEQKKEKPLTLRWLVVRCIRPVLKLEDSAAEDLIQRLSRSLQKEYVLLERAEALVAFEEAVKEPRAVIACMANGDSSRFHKGLPSTSLTFDTEQYVRLTEEIKAAKREFRAKIKALQGEEDVAATVAAVCAADDVLKVERNSRGGYGNTIDRLNRHRTAVATRALIPLDIERLAQQKLASRSTASACSDDDVDGLDREKKQDDYEEEEEKRRGDKSSPHRSSTRSREEGLNRSPARRGNAEEAESESMDGSLASPQSARKTIHRHRLLTSPLYKPQSRNSKAQRELAIATIHAHHAAQKIKVLRANRSLVAAPTFLTHFRSAFGAGVDGGALGADGNDDNTDCELFSNLSPRSEGHNSPFSNTFASSPCGGGTFHPSPRRAVVSPFAFTATASLLSSPLHSARRKGRGRMAAVLSPTSSKGTNTKSFSGRKWEKELVEEKKRVGQLVLNGSYRFEDDFVLSSEAFAFVVLEATVKVSDKAFDFILEYISDKFGAARVEELRRRSIISDIFADACEAYRPFLDEQHPSGVRVNEMTPSSADLPQREVDGRDLHDASKKEEEEVGEMGAGRGVAKQSSESEAETRGVAMSGSRPPSAPLAGRIRSGISNRSTPLDLSCHPPPSTAAFATHSFGAQPSWPPPSASKSRGGVQSSCTPLAVPSTDPMPKIANGLDYNNCNNNNDALLIDYSFVLTRTALAQIVNAYLQLEYRSTSTTVSRIRELNATPQAHSTTNHTSRLNTKASMFMAQDENDECFLFTLNLTTKSKLLKAQQQQQQNAGSPAKSIVAGTPTFTTTNDTAAPEKRKSTQTRDLEDVKREVVDKDSQRPQQQRPRRSSMSIHTNTSDGGLLGLGVQNTMDDLPSNVVRVSRPSSATTIAAASRPSPTPTLLASPAESRGIQQISPVDCTIEEIGACGSSASNKSKVMMMPSLITRDIFVKFVADEWLSCKPEAFNHRVLLLRTCIMARRMERDRAAQRKEEEDDAEGETEEEQQDASPCEEGFGVENGAEECLSPSATSTPVAFVSIDVGAITRKAMLGEEGIKRFSSSGSSSANNLLLAGVEKENGDGNLDAEFETAPISTPTTMQEERADVDAPSKPLHSDGVETTVTICVKLSPKKEKREQQQKPQNGEQKAEEMKSGDAKENSDSQQTISTTPLSPNRRRVRVGDLEITADPSAVDSSRTASPSSRPNSRGPASTPKRGNNKKKATLITQERFECLCASTVTDATERPIVLLLAPEYVRRTEATCTSGSPSSLLSSTAFSSGSSSRPSSPLLSLGLEKFSIYPAVLVEQYFWNTKNPLLRRREPDRFANGSVAANKQQQPHLYTVSSEKTVREVLAALGERGGMARGHWYYVEFSYEGLNRHPLLGQEVTRIGAQWPPEEGFDLAGSRSVIAPSPTAPSSSVFRSRRLPESGESGDEPFSAGRQLDVDHEEDYVCGESPFGAERNNEEEGGMNSPFSSSPRSSARREGQGFGGSSRGVRDAKDEVEERDRLLTAMSGADVCGGLLESFLRQLSRLILSQRRGGVHPSFRVFVRYPSMKLSSNSFPTIAHRTCHVIDLVNSEAVTEFDTLMR